MRVLSPITARPRTPPGVGKRQGGPSASCARGRRHTGNDRIYTLRKVLLHARTFEAKRATPGERTHAKTIVRCGRAADRAPRANMRGHNPWLCGREARASLEGAFIQVRDQSAPVLTPKSWGKRKRASLEGALVLAIAAWEKGASRAIDCKAIGGSGGWKTIARVGRVRRASAATRPCTLASRRRSPQPPNGRKANERARREHYIEETGVSCCGRLVKSRVSACARLDG